MIYFVKIRFSRNAGQKPDERIPEEWGQAVSPPGVVPGETLEPRNL
jgi:hypothetical protein